MTIGMAGFTEPTSIALLSFIAWVCVATKPSGAVAEAVPRPSDEWRPVIADVGARPPRTSVAARAAPVRRCIECS